MYYFFNDIQRKIEVTTYRELLGNLEYIEGIAQSEDDPFVFEFDNRFLQRSLSPGEPPSGPHRFVRILSFTRDDECIVYGIEAESFDGDEMSIRKVGQQMFNVAIRGEITLLSPQQPFGRHILDKELEILRLIDEA